MNPRHRLFLLGLSILLVTAVEGCSDDGGEATTAGDSASGDGDGDGDGGGDAGCADGPLAAPIAGCTPTPVPDSGDFHQDCVDRINQFRWECQCLPPLERWVEAEGCTDQQSADDQATNSPHGNFPACGENAQNTCPNWGSADQVVGGCLQLMWDEGPGEDFQAHGHYINMSSTSYSKVACGRSETASGVWSNQNFAP